MNGKNRNTPGLSSSNTGLLCGKERVDTTLLKFLRPVLRQHVCSKRSIGADGLVLTVFLSKLVHAVNFVPQFRRPTF